MTDAILTHLIPDLAFIVNWYAKPLITEAIRRGDAPAWYDERDPHRWSKRLLLWVVSRKLDDCDINRHPHIPKWLVDTFGLTHYDFMWWDALNASGVRCKDVRLSQCAYGDSVRKAEWTIFIYQTLIVENQVLRYSD